jgi:hypothetical protein
MATTATVSLSPASPGVQEVLDARYAKLADEVIAHVLIVTDGAPTADVGEDGDSALDKNTFNIWGPKVAGAWPGSPAATPPSGGSSAAIQTIISTGATARTFALSDAGCMVKFTQNAAIAASIPNDSALALPTGTVIDFMAAGSGIITVGGSGVTIRRLKARQPSVTVTSGSAVIGDTGCQPEDIWKAVPATANTPAGYVGVPMVPGTSFTLSSTCGTQTNANATTTGTVTMTIGVLDTVLTSTGQWQHGRLLKLGTNEWLLIWDTRR